MAERTSLPRESCVVVFQREDGTSGVTPEQLRELAPMEERDLLAEDGAGRLRASSLWFRNGISDVHRRPEEWPEGYREAVEALDTGERFHSRNPVQIYGRQILERVAESVSPETRESIRRQFLGEHPERILTEETRETAERFFDADLNLSVAARQMFIHRNTLTYRLDKIQRETGLDLRKFSDAAVFRLLMMLPEA